MDWKELYKQKCVTAEEAISHIHDGDRVATAWGCCEPVGIERVMLENYKNFHDVQISNMLLLGDTFWVHGTK